MNSQLTGFGPNNGEIAQVDATWNALRISQRPLDYTSVGGVPGGHFAIGGQTGTMAAGIASAAQVFQVRWADPTKLFVLKKLVVQCATLTGFAATSLGAPLELIVGHGSTANGSGGAALAPTSSSNKLRSAMASTAFATSGEIRIATTAALVAATGQTLEAAAVSECLGAPNATLARTEQMMLFEQRDMGTHPLILNSGDSLAVRTLNPAATGTWVACFSMEWVELVSY
jgi:hypothetical protein